MTLNLGPGFESVRPNPILENIRNDPILQELGEKLAEDQASLQPTPIPSFQSGRNFVARLDPAGIMPVYDVSGGVPATGRCPPIQTPYGFGNSLISPMDYDDTPQGSVSGSTHIVTEGDLQSDDSYGMVSSSASSHMTDQGFVLTRGERGIPLVSVPHGMHPVPR